MFKFCTKNGTILFLVNFCYESKSKAFREFLYLSNMIIQLCDLLIFYQWSFVGSPNILNIAGQKVQILGKNKNALRYVSQKWEILFIILL